MLSSSNAAPSPQELMSRYRAEFRSQLAAGKIRPLVLPYHFYGFGLLVLYLLLPHTERPWLYAARWPVLVSIVVFQLTTLADTSSMDMATGYGAGLVSVWGIMWSMTWLVWNRPQFDAKRVDRQNKGADIRSKKEQESEVNGVVDSEMSNGDLALRKRSQSNGIIGSGEKGVPSGASGKAEKREYYWQSYPESLRDRVEWVMDLIANQRGEGWNWAIPTLPDLPPSVKLSLGEPLDSSTTSSSSETSISSVGIRRFSTRRALLRSRLPKLIGGYFLIDILKTIMISDPYFLLGPNTYNVAYHLSSFSPFTLRLYRQLITFLTITLGLEMGFIVLPLAALTASVLPGGSHLGVRTEAWLYPTTWGSLSTIFAKGLPGLWGSWWHQTFRFAFSAPTNYLIAHKYLTPRSASTKFLSVLFAFSMSGLLHVGGSMTQFPVTNPLHPFMFFILQGLGILLQETVCVLLKQYITNLPIGVRKTGNFVFTVGWLVLTADLLIDDMARGGIWLYEPIPISPLRGLGFGNKGDGWWCWGHMGVGWYKGKHWWESGVALGGVSIE